MTPDKAFGETGRQWWDDDVQ